MHTEIKCLQNQYPKSNIHLDITFLKFYGHITKNKACSLLRFNFS